MTVKLIFFLLIGTVAMGIPILTMAKRFNVISWKAIVLTLMLTIAGTIGTFLMFYVENRKFGGLSFYGAVFLVPLVFMAVPPILQIPYRTALDFCAVGECIMLALMKVHCYTGNCCLGRVLISLSSGDSIRFPSRLVEMVVAIVLFVILFRWAMQRKKCGELYAWYLLLYGSTRFILNIFREAWVTKEMLFPFGNIWSLMAIFVALFWLVNTRKRGKKCNYQK